MAFAGALILVMSMQAGTVDQPLLTLRDMATVSTPEVHLGDVAAVGILPADLQDKARALLLGRLVPGQKTAMLAKEEILSRARALMPALGRWLPRTAAGGLAVQYTQRNIGEHAPSQSACLRTLHALPAGAPVQDENFAPALCRSKPSPAFLYDRVTGALRTKRDLASDELVNSYPGRGEGKVYVGQPITLRASVGSATIEHKVQAMQVARPGDRLFVRTSEGLYHSVRYEGPVQ